LRELSLFILMKTQTSPNSSKNFCKTKSCINSYNKTNKNGKAQPFRFFMRGLGFHNKKPAESNHEGRGGKNGYISIAM